MDTGFNIPIEKSHWNNGVKGLRRFEKEIRILLSQYQLPKIGWSDEEISFFFMKMSLLDTNNHRGYFGVGEREGRTNNALIRRRCFGMTHGIGRSGDILADQPKAAGSSMLYKIANKLVLNCMRAECGLRHLKNALILPMCTGMALAHVFLTLKSMDGNQEKKFVIISQIDQQTCLKCIIYASLHPIIIPLRAVNSPSIGGHSSSNGLLLHTDIPCMEATLQHLPAGSVLCIVSTTSCFSPRLPDDVESISKLCLDHCIPHVVNHAYGLQSKSMSKTLSSVMQSGAGRVDFVVCSTDKNFVVPVGGSVIASPVARLVELSGKMYPGRSSAAPVHDLLISLLSLGKLGFQNLYSVREKCLFLFRANLMRFAEEKNELFIAHPNNDISFGMSLRGLLSKHHTQLGAEIFTLGATGCRVVVFDGKKKIIGSFCFESYGSHQSTYTTSSYEIPSPIHTRMQENLKDLPKVPYLTVACAIGMKEEEATKFISKLRIVYEKFAKV